MRDAHLDARGGQVRLERVAGTTRREQMHRLLRRREREGLTYAELAELTGEQAHTLSWWASLLPPDPPPPEGLRPPVVIRWLGVPRRAWLCCASAQRSFADASALWFLVLIRGLQQVA